MYISKKLNTYIFTYMFASNKATTLVNIPHSESVRCVSPNLFAAAAAAAAARSCLCNGAPMQRIELEHVASEQARAGSNVV